MTKLSKNLLHSLGLTEVEAAVYFAALELGEGTVQALARKSGLKRTSIYNFIDELKDRGFIVESKKKGRRVYCALHPRQLLEIEKTRLTELEQALPELLAIHNQSPKKPRVTFFEGLEAIENVYWGMLADKQPIVAWEDLEHMEAVLRPAFYKGWPEERAKRNITFKVILRDSRAAREFVKGNIRLLRESKFITSGDLKTGINIYGDKVALISFRNKPVFCVVIEDHDIAETLRVGWTELWKRLEPAIG
ncbi:MAG: helix-turn-helix domain-containing protein [Patescibacteria group bacterium]